MCSMQAHRWLDGRQLCATGLIGRWGRWPAFYVAMPSTTGRQLIGQVPTVIEGTIVGRVGGEHVYDLGTAR
jgi:hypothetical protein